MTLLPLADVKAETVACLRPPDQYLFGVGTELGISWLIAHPLNCRSNSRAQTQGFFSS